MRDMALKDTPGGIEQRNVTTIQANIPAAVWESLSASDSFTGLTDENSGAGDSGYGFTAGGDYTKKFMIGRDGFTATEEDPTSGDHWIL